jgi:hypothetical protein
MQRSLQVNGHEARWPLYLDSRNCIEAADVADSAERARITAHDESQNTFFDSRISDSAPIAGNSVHISEGEKQFDRRGRRGPQRKAWLFGVLCGPPRALRFKAFDFFDRRSGRHERLSEVALKNFNPFLV